MKKLLLLLVIPFFVACSQVDTGNVGIESSMGQYKAEELMPGVYFTLFKNVIEISAKENGLSLNDLKPKSKDNLTMADFDFDFYYRIDPSKASELLLKYRGDLSEPGNDGAQTIGVSFVTRQAREAAYKAAAQVNAADMHTKRADISAMIQQAMQSELDKDAGKGAFVVTNVIIRNIVTDPALESAIKEAGKVQFEIQAKQKQVELAKAEADRKRIEAQGDADAIMVRAKAISAQGGAEYVQLKAVEKWDGKMPTTTGGALPFINVK